MLSNLVSGIRTLFIDISGYARFIIYGKMPMFAPKMGALPEKFETLQIYSSGLSFSILSVDLLCI